MCALHCRGRTPKGGFYLMKMSKKTKSSKVNLSVQDGGAGPAREPSDRVTVPECQAGQKETATDNMTIKAKLKEMSKDEGLQVDTDKGNTTEEESEQYHTPVGRNPFARASKITRTPPKRASHYEETEITAASSDTSVDSVLANLGFGKKKRSDKRVVYDLNATIIEEQCEEQEEQDSQPRETSTPLDRSEAGSQMEEEEESVGEWLFTENVHKRKRVESPLINITINSGRYADLIEKLTWASAKIGEVLGGGEDLGQEIRNQLEGIKKALEEEILETGREMDPQEKSHMATQVNPEDIARDISAAEIREQMTEEMNMEEIKRAIKLEWPENTYRVKVSADNITSTDIEGKIVVMSPYDKMKELKFVNQLIGSSKCMMRYVRSAKIKQDEIVELKTEGSVIVAGKMMKDTKDVSLVGLTNSLQEEDIHIACMSPLCGEMKRKIIECATYNYSGRIVIHEKSIIRNKGGKDRKRYETEAVLIQKPEALSYAQMVSSLKKR
ncbi:hypothetical protein WA026_014765 [Henosepilachna vigintioctopunctata]|uniref:Uncharacterized protein n=1 Tax=Henosepilachna vigintioctopunctata TaxID=420089 RepID=A0AAW1VGT2_9CUCU